MSIGVVQQVQCVYHTNFFGLMTLAMGAVNHINLNGMSAFWNRGLKIILQPPDIIFIWHRVIKIYVILQKRLNYMKREFHWEVGMKKSGIVIMQSQCATIA